MKKNISASISAFWLWARVCAVRWAINDVKANKTNKEILIQEYSSLYLIPDCLKPWLSRAGGLLTLLLTEVQYLFRSESGSVKRIPGNLL